MVNVAMTSPDAPTPEPVERAVPSRRERARAATIDEIKETALRLMHEQGSTDLRFSDIARAMGMTAPALYRYFTDRDELLTALIVDAYDDLGAAVAAAREQVAADDLPGRILAVAQAYRQWVVNEPQRFALIFGMPVPGYAAPEQGATTEAAQRAMVQLKSIYSEAAQRERLGAPLVQHVEPVLATAIAQKHEGDDIDPADLAPETFQACMHTWAWLHGFVSLETYGHFDFFPPEARDALFVSMVEAAARTSGFPWK